VLLSAQLFPQTRKTNQLSELRGQQPAKVLGAPLIAFVIFSLPFNSSVAQPELVQLCGT